MHPLVISQYCMPQLRRRSQLPSSSINDLDLEATDMCVIRNMSKVIPIPSSLTKWLGRNSFLVLVHLEQWTWGVECNCAELFQTSLHYMSVCIWTVGSTFSMFSKSDIDRLCIWVLHASHCSINPLLNNRRSQLLILSPYCVYTVLQTERV